MKKKILFILFVFSISVSLFAQEINVINEELIEDFQFRIENIDLRDYQIVNLEQKADEELIIYNYSGNKEAFDVLCLYSEYNEKEWIRAAKTGELEPTKIGTRKGFMTSYDLEDKCRNCDDVCEVVAIRTKSGKKYNYKVYVKFYKLYIEVYPYSDEKNETDW